jgi:two-component system phosphate regulon sensor histidine kinase PhoR
MENLIENSIKYSGDTVAISISANRQKGQLSIIHRDNGWGLSPVEINQIFDRFYRGTSARKRRQNGFGLGLTYVKLMVQQLGGTISVTGKENAFAEFCLTFDTTKNETI